MNTKVFLFAAGLASVAGLWAVSSWALIALVALVTTGGAVYGLIRFHLWRLHKRIELGLKQSALDWETAKTRALEIASASPGANVKATPDGALEIIRSFPPAHVTVKEVAEPLKELAAPPLALPIAPPFSEIVTQVAPGHLFLGQGVGGPIWGDMIDLLSTLGAGRPHMGKSTLLRCVCGQVLKVNGQPIILDPHGSILDDLGASFQCAESPQEIDQYSKWIIGQITARLEIRKSQPAFQPLLMIVDELPIVSEMSKEALNAIKRVVLEGRKVAMYAFIMGQGVPAELLGGTLVRDAMSSRYVFLTTTRQATMAGIENETAKKLMPQLEGAGPGKAILSTWRRNQPEIIAIPYTTTADIRALAGNVRETAETRETFVEADGNAETGFHTTEELSVEDSSFTGNAIRETIKRLRHQGVPFRDISSIVGLSGRKYSTFQQICREEGLT